MCESVASNVYLPFQRRVQGRRILNGKSTQKRSIVNTGEAFEDVQIPGRSTNPGRGCEICRVDDERATE
jgi:hypothetical protein